MRILLYFFFNQNVERFIPMVFSRIKIVFNLSERCLNKMSFCYITGPNFSNF
jgi:hypothetical protein